MSAIPPLLGGKQTLSELREIDVHDPNRKRADDGQKTSVFRSIWQAELLKRWLSGKPFR